MNKTSYKYKFLGILVVLLVMLILSYQRGLKHTFSLYGQLQQLEGSVTELDGMDYNSAVVKSQLKKLNKFLLSESQRDELQYRILKEVNEAARKHKVTMVETARPHEIKKNGCSIITQKFKLTGGFHRLTKLIYTLETNQEEAKIASVNYFIKKDYQLDKNELFCEIYMQSIIGN